MGASRSTLRRRLEAGHPIDPTALDDRLYRGVSLGLPRFVEKMTWKTFFKAFHRDPSGPLRGWNVRAVQNGVEGPWIPQRRGEAPRTFGHFRVVDGAGGDPRGSGRQGLLLDYGQGGNKPLDPVGRLRDPLVALHPGDVDLLLGWSYLAIAGRPVGTPSYFVLIRGQPLDHVAHPPIRPVGETLHQVHTV